MTDEPEETPEQECRAYLDKVKRCIASILDCSIDKAETYIGFLIEQTDAGTDVKLFSHDEPMYWAILCLALHVRFKHKFLDDVHSAMRVHKTLGHQPFSPALNQDIRQIIEDRGGLRESLSYHSRGAPEQTAEQECQAFLDAVKSYIVALLGCSLDNAKNYMGLLIERTGGGRNLNHFSYAQPIYLATACIGLSVADKQNWMDETLCLFIKHKPAESQPLAPAFIEEFRNLIAARGGLTQPCDQVS